MKTILTLLILSMAAPTAFAQSDCAKLKAQEMKIEKVSQKLKEQQEAVDAILKSIKTKNYVIDASSTTMFLSIGAFGAYAVQRVFYPGSRAFGEKVMIAGMSAGAAALCVMFAAGTGVPELQETLEKKQSELSKQEDALEDAQEKLELLKAFNPKCH